MLVPGAPRRCPDEVPRRGAETQFCTTRFFCNISFVDFERGNESVGGDLEENDYFELKKCIARQTKQ